MVESRGSFLSAIRARLRLRRSSTPIIRRPVVREYRIDLPGCCLDLSLKSHRNRSIPKRFTSLFFRAWRTSPWFALTPRSQVRLAGPCPNRRIICRLIQSWDIGGDGLTRSPRTTNIVGYPDLFAADSGFQSTRFFLAASITSIALSAADDALSPRKNWFAALTNFWRRNLSSF